MSEKSHKKRIIVLLIIIFIIILGLAFGAYKLVTMSPEQSGSATTVADQNKESTESLAAIISSTNDLNDFEKQLKNVGLFTDLEGNTPYTIFAFTNTGYKNSEQAVKDLFKQTDTELTKNIMNYHIASGKIDPDAMVDGLKIKTMNGSEIIVKSEDKSLYIVDMKGDKRKVIEAGIPAKNGAIYEIDGVLLPQ
jgi:uncharacterized surface protein with fasciclin (FAS1) repeats